MRETWVPMVPYVVGSVFKEILYKNSPRSVAHAVDAAVTLFLGCGAVGKSGTSLMVGRHPVHSAVEVGWLYIYHYLPLFHRVWTTSQVVGLGISEPSTLPLTHIPHWQKENHYLQKCPWLGEMLVIRTL